MAAAPVASAVLFWDAQRTQVLCNTVVSDSYFLDNFRNKNTALGILAQGQDLAQIRFLPLSFPLAQILNDN